MANTLLAIGASPAMVHGGLNILMLTNEGNLEKFMTPTTIFWERRVRGYVVEQDILVEKSIISTDTKTKFSLPTIFFRTCASGKSKQGRRVEVAFYNSVS